MNKKYAYCTSITKDLFIPCIILNKKIMNYLECKYPLIVLVTDEVSDKGIKEMEDYNIIVKKINIPLKYIKPIGIINFFALMLENYDKVFVFEADIILLLRKYGKNEDNIFNIKFKKN